MKTREQREEDSARYAAETLFRSLTRVESEKTAISLIKDGLLGWGRRIRREAYKEGQLDAQIRVLGRWR